MFKVLGALATALVILAVGFIVLPKLLVKAPGTSVNQPDPNVPVGRSRPLPSLTPSTRSAAAVTPDARRYEDFASIQSRAGFTPLTPSGLPSGYQPWEQYLRTSDPAEIVITYRKPDDLYLLIVERKVDPSAAGSFPFGRPNEFQRFRSGSPTPFAGQVQSPLVDIGGVSGRYVQGFSGPVRRALGEAEIEPLQRNSQPHAVFFNHGDVQVTVEADQTDVSRDQLIQIAAGLR